MSIYYKVYCPSTVLAGDVLSYNEITSLWEIATSQNAHFGIARTDAIARGEGFSTELVLDGYVLAKASRSIPPQGGKMHVENGQVYVDNSSEGCGVICPQEIDNTTPRNAGDLVSIIVR
jgi:hypothetical protein